MQTDTHLCPIHTSLKTIPFWRYHEVSRPVLDPGGLFFRALLRSVEHNVEEIMACLVDPLFALYISWVHTWGAGGNGGACVGDVGVVDAFW